MGIYAIAFTDKGMELGGRLSSVTDGEIQLRRCEDSELYKWTGEHFVSGGVIIFIGAVGIAVRAVAPFLNRKALDPAVLVIDEEGRFVIPLLSGHIGGANSLAVALADYLGAAAVITTATDLQNVFSVDTWAVNAGLKIANPEKIKHVSAKLLRGESVAFSSVFPIGGELPEGLVCVPDDTPCDFTISYLSGVAENTLHLVPPVLTLGIGCKKDTSVDALTAAYAQFIEDCGCHKLAVCRICSIDLKENEQGLLDFAAAQKLPVSFFSAEELKQVSGSFSSSEFVEETTGVDNVCERAAVLGSGGTLLVRKTVLDGITMAIAVKEP